MKISPFIFRNYDIRGTVPAELNPESVKCIAKAYGTYLRRRKIRQMVIGHDCRLSSPDFNQAFIEGVTEMGIDVIDIGTVMTQMMYFAQYRFQTNGGVMITASHNPKNYNGFKMAIGYSQTTEENEIAELKKLTENEDFFKSDRIGTVTKENVAEDYYNDVLKRVNIKQKYKVVIDSHFGTTGLYNPEIFRRAGCEVVELNTKPDGNFPAGTPDPTEEKVMQALADQVLKHNADIGITFDGDGDRTGMVDEKGHILWNDIAVAIFSQEILSRFPGSKVVYNTLCTQAVPQVIEKAGGIPIMWRVGHAYIKSKIAAENAVFGGELSGHFFFNDNAYGHDDGTYAILRILEYLSEKKMTLSQLYESFPQYISSPEIKLECPDDKKIAIIKEISQQFRKDFPNAIKITDDTVIPGDDGTRLDLPDGMMVFRYSQNGPYVTIKFEAKDQATYEDRRRYVSTMLKKYPEIIWEGELCVNVEVVR